MRIKTEVGVDFCIYDLEGPLEDNINMLQEHKTKLEQNDWTDLYLETHHTGDSVHLSIVGYRLETPQEVKKRLAKYKKELAARKRLKEKEEESQRKLYEQLKKKFDREVDR